MRLLSSCQYRNEFTEVYELLFSNRANHASKKVAFNKMMVWKGRSHDKTPASILSTLALLGVELNSEICHLSETDVSTLYSNALTKFLNYMTSVTQVKRFKTMYQAAAELGLDPYLIDLRHLCAHGNRTPSLETLQRVHQYCMHWLKGYYWDHLVQTLQPVTSVDLKTDVLLAMQTKLDDLFTVYDNATEVIIRGSNDGDVDTEKRNNLESFVEKMEDANAEMPTVAKTAMKNIAKLLKTNTSVPLHKISILLCSLILSPSRKRFFLESPTDTQKLKQDVIETHQQLFRQLSAYGLIGDFMNGLIRCAENQSESKSRRMGAMFWVEALVEALKIFDLFCVTLKEIIESSDCYENPNFSELNQETLRKDHLRIYQHMGHTERTVLIFGENVQYPNTFRLTKRFIEQRMLHVDDVTVNFVGTCIDGYVGTDMTEEERNRLEGLLAAYLPKSPDTTNVSTAMDVDDGKKTSDRIYTLEDIIVPQTTEKQRVWRNAGRRNGLVTLNLTLILCF